MKFFQTLIASILGTILALILLFIIALITLAGSTEEPEPYVQNNTVLKMHISGDLPSRNADNPVRELFNPGTNDKVSLQTLKENLAKAAVQDKIKGVWLDIDFVASGWANLEEAHRLIAAFRDSSDKFVYASTNDIGFNEQGYYLATAADSIFSPPESFFEFDGFYSQVTFYTGLFDKLGIDAEITRHGKYKSAVEPYFLKKLSDASRYQLQQLIDDVSTAFVGAVSKKTAKSAAEINELLNSSPSLVARYGYENGLIDSLLYTDQLKDLIKKRIGLSADESFKTISNSRYFKVSASKAGLTQSSTDNRIAVIYASGAIMPEVSGTSPFSSQAFITASFFKEQLKKIKDDANIKALVVRVNSPGGSGSTSDAIWRMLKETRKRIPVIVSMGPVAASGGYYISVAADTIVAEPNTITGSIGVFSTKFNTKQLFNKELGITFDEVKSHKHADWLSPTRALTPTEEKAFQHYVDGFYHTFISKVATARGLTVEAVDSIAQGRVWSGQDAKKQHLVDILGGLDTALAVAAEKAGITDYKVVDYPKPKNIYELLTSSAGSKVQSWMNSLSFGAPYTREVARQLALLRQQGPLLLFPYQINIQ